MMQSRRFRPLVRRAVVTAFGAQAALGSAWSLVFGLPSAVKWMDEVALVLIAIAVLPQLVRQRERRRWTLAASAPLLAFSALVLASGIVNRTPPMEMLLGWRSLAQFLTFYLLAVHFEIGVQDLRDFFTGFIAAGFVHVPMSISSWASAPAGYLGIDQVTGGFGAGTANLFGYFCGVITLLSLCLASSGRKMVLLLAVPFVAIWSLASANGSYLAFELVACGVLAISPEMRRPLNMACVLALVGLQFAAVNYVDQKAYKVSAVHMMTSAVKNMGRQRIDDMGNPGRLSLLRSTSSLLVESPSRLMLGLGPGTVATVGAARPSNLSLFRDRSHSEFVFASVIGHFAELGAVGLVVILGIWTYFSWIVLSTYRRCQDPAARRWLLAATLIVAFAVLAGGGDISWSFQPIMYPALALAAFATVHRDARGFHLQRPGRRTSAAVSVSEAGECAPANRMTFSG